MNNEPDSYAALIATLAFLALVILAGIIWLRAQVGL